MSDPRESPSMPWKGSDLPVPFEESFDALVGLEFLEVGADRVVGRCAVRDELLGATGTVHGGVYSAMSESLASTGTAVAVMADGLIAVGMSNDTTVVQEIAGGTLLATCDRTHAGDDRWLWRVKIRDQDDRLCAVTDMAIAVRPARPNAA